MSTGYIYYIAPPSAARPTMSTMETMHHVRATALRMIVYFTLQPERPISGMYGEDIGGGTCYLLTKY